MIGKRWCAALAVVVLVSFAWTWAQAGDEQKALESAVGYLLKNQAESGGWPRVVGEGQPEAEPTAWAVRCLVLTGGKKEAITNGIRFLLKAQKESGSVDDNSARAAFLIMALDAAGTEKKRQAKAAQWLIANQNPDGGWGRSPKTPSLSIYTAVVLKALATAGSEKSDKASVSKALAYLESMQNPDGGWPMQKGGKSLALGTAWVLNAFADFNVTKGNPLVGRGLEFLMQCRKKHNGGFSIVPPAPEDPEVTAYVMLALVAQKANPDAVKQAAHYLTAVQLPDGAYISNTPMQFKKKRKENVQTTCFVIWALKAAGY